MTTPSEQHAAIIGWIEEREALARAAVGKRWVLAVDGDDISVRDAEDNTEWLYTEIAQVQQVEWDGDDDDAWQSPTARHIAAWSPAVTLPLLALLRQQADEALGYCASDGNYNRWNAALAALYAATVGAAADG